MRRYISFYNIYILICLLVWMTFSIYFLFATKAGIPPDETYHLGVIEQYKQVAIFLKDNETSYFLGQISRTPFLYHFLASKALVLNNLLNMPELYFLRMISYIIGIVYFIISLKFIKEASENKLTHLLFITFVTFTTMLPFLFSSVHYDNMINLLSVASFLYLLRYYKTQDLKYVLYVAAVGLLGILVKSTYAPLLVLQIIAIFFIYRKSKARSFKELIYIFVANRLLTAGIIVLILINSYYFGLNLLKFNTPFAKCSDVLTHEQCMNNAIYSRGESFSQRELLQPSIVSIVDYHSIWQKRMVGSLFGIYSHHTLSLSRSVVYVLLIFTQICVYLFALKVGSKKFNKLDYIMIFVTLPYILLIFIKNYNSFLIAGIPVATQGRYLIPVLIPLYYLTSKALTHSSKLGKISKTILLILLLLIGQNFYRELLHLSLLESSVYEPSNHIMSLVISKINEAIPFVRLSTFINAVSFR